MHASATKMWSNSCATCTGMFSCSFRTICLMFCILTSSVITNTPLLSINETTEILLLLLCPMECLFVKYNNLAGHMKEQEIPCLLVCLQLTHTPHKLALAEPKRHFKGHHACLKTAMVCLAGQEVSLHEDCPQISNMLRRRINLRKIQHA
jgi:hypothetical protein